jgi:hypothetical protein
MAMLNNQRVCWSTHLNDSVPHSVAFPRFFRPGEPRASLAMLASSAYGNAARSPGIFGYMTILIIDA